MTLTEYMDHLQQHIIQLNIIKNKRGNVEIVTDYDTAPLLEVMYDAETGRAVTFHT